MADRRRCRSRIRCRIVIAAGNHAASGSAAENAPVHALHSERLRAGTASELDRRRVTARSRRDLAGFVPDLLTAGSFRAAGLATTDEALRRFGAIPGPVAGYV